MRDEMKQANARLSKALNALLAHKEFEDDSKWRDFSNDLKLVSRALMHL